LTRPIAQNFWKCRLLHGPVCFPMSCAGWGNQHHLRSKPRATEGNELACEHWRFNTGRRVGILYSFLSPCLCCLFFSTPWLQTKKKEQNEGRCTATCVSRCACAHLASRNSCRRLGLRRRLPVPIFAGDPRSALAPSLSPLFSGVPGGGRGVCGGVRSAKCESTKSHAMKVVRLYEK
jgi:hypothetical protein